MIDIINSILLDFVRRTGSFLPNLISGIFIILVGFLIGGLVKKILLSVFSFVYLSFWRTMSDEGWVIGVG